MQANCLNEIIDGKVNFNGRIEQKNIAEQVVWQLSEQFKGVNSCKQNGKYNMVTIISFLSNVFMFIFKSDLTTIKIRC
jgi:uncharacterized protein YdeI (YjbR/CyaY-like superfamily)